MQYVLYQAKHTLHTPRSILLQLQFDQCKKFFIDLIRVRYTIFDQLERLKIEMSENLSTVFYTRSEKRRLY